MPCVLVISESWDIHANKVEHYLKNRGVDILRFNTDRFISDDIELVFDSTSFNEGISICSHFVEFKHINSVLYRRPGIPQTDITIPAQKDFAEKESQELIKQLYFYLQEPLWVSRYDCLDKARRKYLQLHVASGFGMKVPKTLVTNSPDRIRGLFKSCGGSMVYKTLHAPVIRGNDGPELWGVPTTVLTPELIEKIELIKPTGGVFQEYISKEYELRVTVIGNDIFTARIDSQSETSAKVDWRDAVAHGRVKVTPYALPSKVSNQCISIVNWYGLSFGAIDLIKTPEGEYVFLELNPNGQWLWVEEMTGQPLLDSITELLMRGRPVDYPR